MEKRSDPQKTILIVDDDPDILIFLRDLLELDGYTVIVTPRVNYLEQQQRNWPDLILLDVFLSGNNGREMVLFLKSKEETRKIPIIMFSAHPGGAAIARAAGADDFLEKPFDMDELLAKIQACL